MKTILLLGCLFSFLPMQAFGTTLDAVQNELQAVTFLGTSQSPAKGSAYGVVHALVNALRLLKEELTDEQNAQIISMIDALRNFTFVGAVNRSEVHLFQSRLLIRVGEAARTKNEWLRGLNHLLLPSVIPYLHEMELFHLQSLSKNFQKAVDSFFYSEYAQTHEIGSEVSLSPYKESLIPIYAIRLFKKDLPELPNRRVELQQKLVKLENMLSPSYLGSRIIHEILVPLSIPAPINPLRMKEIIRAYLALADSGDLYAHHLLHHLMILLGKVSSPRAPEFQRLLTPRFVEEQFYPLRNRIDPHGYLRTHDGKIPRRIRNHRVSFFSDANLEVDEHVLTRSFRQMNLWDRPLESRQRLITMALENPETPIEILKSLADSSSGDPNLAELTAAFFEKALSRREPVSPGYWKSAVREVNGSEKTYYQVWFLKCLLLMSFREKRWQKASEIAPEFFIALKQLPEEALVQSLTDFQTFAFVISEHSSQFSEALKIAEDLRSQLRRAERVVAKRRMRLP